MRAYPVIPSGSDLRIQIVLFKYFLFSRPIMAKIPPNVYGILGVLLVLFLLCAGCTQQPTASTPTASLTPTATAVPTSPPATAPATASSGAANATNNLTTIKDEAAMMAANFSLQIDRRNLSSAIREGQNSTAFKTVLAQLIKMKASDSRLIFVYTIEQQNGTVRFLIDADVGNPNGSEFLSPYTDAPEELTKPVNAPIGVGPYTDSWGTFVSGYAPVNMSPDTRIVLIGVDFKS
jgi:ABC-type transport system substrate-binding protein